MTTPLVSVLTPSFNQERWLGDNLTSVARQTYPSVEHIVFDGGSTDGSVSLLEAATFPGLRWSSEPDRGQSHALNKAFAESSGEIIGWLNSDDAYYAADAIQWAVDAFLADPAVDVVFGHALLVGAAGTILQVLYVPPLWMCRGAIHDHLNQPSVFIRRSALGTVLADESFDHAMDRELWLRLRTHKFRRLSRVLALDRHQKDRKSYTQVGVATADRARLVARYGITDSVSYRLRRKATRVVGRVLGIFLVPGMLRQAAAIGLHLDVQAVVTRQLLRPRKAFPWD